MKFDTIIIGGGLTGLICGIRLQQQGQRCIIISSGQSALHFSSGSFDLLNTLPDGNAVSEPLQAIDSLIAQAPEHPYAKLGKENFTRLAKESETFLNDLGIFTTGSADKNHFRVTPMGISKSTWLSLEGFATSDAKATFPWKKVAIFNIEGFLDFYPRFIADEFKNMGIESDIHLFNLPDLDLLRKNPSELRSANIARVLDKEENTDKLAQILKSKIGDCEAIIFPACLGLYNNNTLKRLEKKTGKPIRLLPTLPPSIVGIHTQQFLQKTFVKQGGVYMLGDSVINMEVKDNKVTQVYSYNHNEVPFTGKDFVLATGSYFSQGLIATQNKVYEPIFDLDVSYLPDRQEWYDQNVFHTQNYQQFGVKTNNTFTALRYGNTVDNLYVAGAILEGFNPIKEGCGGGVSILTALYIAENILSK